MNMTLLGTYMLAVLTLLLTPGPVVALVTGTAARYGSRKAFATVVGTNGASLVLIVLAALMLAGVVSLPPVFLCLLGIVGSLFIGWGATTSLWQNIGKGNIEGKTVISERGGLARGFLTGISNPKDILFFISFFPQFIAVTQDFTASIMTLSLVWIIFDFSVLSLYILTVGRWIPEKHGRKIEIISSLFLLVVSLCALIYNFREIISQYF
ncbi:LysE family translocator [Erwinia endophytica]|uniref:LysE family translocator n=1 Tax=Erwinia endophytica TaxID=1563158 RepID=UPI001265FD86|nr:LysE family translocator [Erwinia endophytica]KAB8305220.1 LysE family translocator [Erwinia endophytica]